MKKLGVKFQIDELSSLIGNKIVNLRFDTQTNKLRLNTLVLLCFLCWFVPVAGAQDLYPFTNSQDKAQFSRLTQEVRCLVCQNQSIADSNAPFAADLRAEVYRLIGEHRSDVDIKAHLTQRYGDYVLLQPPLASQTWLLWTAPMGLLLLGFWVLYRLIIKQSQSTVGGKS